MVLCPEVSLYLLVLFFLVFDSLSHLGSCMVKYLVIKFEVQWMVIFGLCWKNFITFYLY